MTSMARVLSVPAFFFFVTHYSEIPFCLWTFSLSVKLDNCLISKRNVSYTDFLTNVSFLHSNKLTRAAWMQKLLLVVSVRPRFESAYVAFIFPPFVGSVWGRSWLQHRFRMLCRILVMALFLDTDWRLAVCLCDRAARATEVRSEKLLFKLSDIFKVLWAL